MKYLLLICCCYLFYIIFIIFKNIYNTIKDKPINYGLIINNIFSLLFILFISYYIITTTYFKFFYDTYEIKYLKIETKEVSIKHNKVFNYNEFLSDSDVYISNKKVNQ
jgi:uncharacterized membrane protein